MNLADAIRIAQHQSLSAQEQEKTKQEKAQTTTQRIEIVDPVPVSTAVTSSGGSVVRLELFLNPEQMHQLLRGILHGAHSVMTLREAAQYLRMTHQTLTDMATAGEIPAFLVDGQWKFPRNAVDEWITLQTLSAQQNEENNQEEGNVA
jgi:excisionase family DNA binding protein